MFYDIRLFRVTVFVYELFIYRVTHIKVDRPNRSKLRFEGQIRKFKKDYSFFKNLIRLIEFFLQQMLGFSFILCVFWR